MTEENSIKVSIVIPSLNEEETIGETVTNALEGIKIASVNGEVIIVDSSTDNSPKIASGLGARVISVPKRGLGQAYIDATSHIKGKYIVMGDADCTYDFKETYKLVQKLDQGYEYVMGTRMKGGIENGAMPALHRYFGNPLTTWILNLLLGTNYSDIHCGLRAMTYDAFKRIDIQSYSWEYASEMVVKSKLLKLRCAEVPIHFYKDKENRKSHHKRLGWFSPWQAGWINLKVMFLYVPNQLIIRPGLIFLLIGLSLICMQINGPVTIGAITLSTNFMLLGLTLAILGSSLVQMGILVKQFSDLNRFINSKFTKFIYKYFTYTRGMIIGLFLSLFGFIMSSWLVLKWYVQGYKLHHVPWYVIFGLFLIILGIQTILFTLICEAFALKGNRGKQQK